MNNEILQISIVTLSALAAGWTTYLLAKWIKSISDKKKQTRTIEDLKKDTWLEVKKGRGYGRNKFYLVTLKNNKKVRQSIKKYEFEVYRQLGIKPKGQAAIEHDKRVRTVDIV